MVWIEVLKTIGSLKTGDVRQIAKIKADPLVKSGHVKYVKAPKKEVSEDNPKRGRPAKIETASIEPKEVAKVETAEVTPVIEKKSEVTKPDKN